MGKKDREGAIHFQDLFLLCEEPKAPVLSRLFPAPCAYASRWSHDPHCPRPGLRSKGVFGTNLYSASSDLTASALVGTLGQMRSRVPGACQAGAGGNLRARSPLSEDRSLAIIQTYTLMGTWKIAFFFFSKPQIKYSKVGTPSPKCWGCLLPLQQLLSPEQSDD